MCNHGDKVWHFTAWVPQVGFITVRVPACVITGGLLNRKQQLLICPRFSCCQVSKHLLCKHVFIYTFISESLIQHPHNGCLLDFMLFFRRKYDLIYLFWCISRFRLAPVGSGLFQFVPVGCSWLQLAPVGSSWLRSFWLMWESWGVSCVLTWTFLFHHSWKPKEFSLFHLVVSGLQLKRFYTRHVSIHICPDVQQFTNGGRKRWGGRGQDAT